MVLLITDDFLKLFSVLLLWILVFRVRYFVHAKTLYFVGVRKLCFLFRHLVSPNNLFDKNYILLVEKLSAASWRMIENLALIPYLTEIT